MSRPEIIEEKRGRLTPEKRAALEARLRDAAADAAAALDAAAPAREDAARESAGWAPQAPPDWLEWEALVAAGRAQARRPPARLDLRVVPPMVEAANRMSVAYICAALRELGAYAAAGESHTAESLVGRFGILPQFLKLMRRWLALLAQEGLLEDVGGAYRARAPLPGGLVAETLAGLGGAADYGDYAGVVGFIRANGENLAPLITGRRIALENLFAGGSSDLPETVYQGAPHARYFNAIVREVLETAAKSLPRGRQLRVLEVGAGTGGTTRPLLPALPPEDTAYVFTDVSAYFLKNAERMFGKYPFVSYQLCDIDEDPLALGFKPRAFDVLVAANVLHCARDIGVTLGRLRSLLQPGGLLVMIEVTRAERWHNIAMGLLTGFLNFEDERLADNEPLLDCARWERVLRARGFAHFAAFPEAGLPTEVVGQHVLMARADDDNAAAELAPTPPPRPEVP